MPTGSPLKGKAPLETGASNVAKEMLFPSSQNARDIDCYRIPHRSQALRSISIVLGTAEDHAPNSMHPFSSLMPEIWSIVGESRILAPVWAVCELTDQDSG